MPDDRTAALRKRFYKTVSVSPNNGRFAILLDERRVMTPGKAPVLFNSEPLAAAAAAEWAAQGEKIDPLTMPLTQIACTAIDRVTPNREETEETIVRYGETDLLCYGSDSPSDLVARENELWSPLLDWLGKEKSIHLERTTSILAVTQPQEALNGLRVDIRRFDDHELTALTVMTQTMGSVVLALAVADGVIDADAAATASQLHETFQSELWGADREAEQRLRILRGEISDAARYLALHREGGK